MATYTYADLHIEEARELADLTGIEADLRQARGYAEALINLMNSPTPDWSLAEPLSIALAVAYSRPFASGVRLRLNESDLMILSGPQREAHDHLRAYRDKHVAHSVNAFEHNQPRAHYWAERVETEGIIAIGCSHGRVASLGTLTIQVAHELTDVLTTHVNARLAAERERLLAVVRSKPLSEILNGGKHGAILDRAAPVGERRRK